MSLQGDLLDQAKQLAQLDLRRPKQANLRRAVSSACYGLFHLLTSEASALYAAEPELAARINRTLSLWKRWDEDPRLAEIDRRYQSEGGHLVRDDAPQPTTISPKTLTIRRNERHF